MKFYNVLFKTEAIVMADSEDEATEKAYNESEQIEANLMSTDTYEFKPDCGGYTVQDMLRVIPDYISIVVRMYGCKGASCILCDTRVNGDYPPDILPLQVCCVRPLDIKTFEVFVWGEQ